MVATSYSIRIDDDLRAEAQEVFESMGLSLPQAVNVFLNRCVADRGIPFQLKAPAASKPVSSSVSEVCAGIDPFAFLKTEQDVDDFVRCFIKDNVSKKASTAAARWEEIERELYEDAAGYMLENLPREQRDFATMCKVLDMARFAEPKACKQQMPTQIEWPRWDDGALIDPAVDFREYKAVDPDTGKLLRAHRLVLDGGVWFVAEDDRNRAVAQGQGPKHNIFDRSAFEHVLDEDRPKAKVVFVSGKEDPDGDAAADRKTIECIASKWDDCMARCDEAAAEGRATAAFAECESFRAYLEQYPQTVLAGVFAVFRHALRPDLRFAELLADELEKCGDVDYFERIGAFDWGALLREGTKILTDADWELLAAGGK